MVPLPASPNGDGFRATAQMGASSPSRQNELQSQRRAAAAMRASHRLGRGRVSRNQRIASGASIGSHATGVSRRGGGQGQ
jgi:hypothetical protein